MPGRNLYPQGQYSRSDNQRHVHDRAARGRANRPHDAAHSTVQAKAESADTDDLLSVLEDDCGRRLLEQVAAEAKPARALVDAVDASRATVYRRLNALEDAGLVETATEYDEDGHHRKVFRATLERVTLELDDGGLSATVATSTDG